MSNNEASRIGKRRARGNKRTAATQQFNSSLNHVLGGANVQILVLAMETGQILFANDLMNKAHRIDYDPVGLPCWEVYHGLSDRCEFCRIPELQEHPETAIEWDEYNPHIMRWFHHRESIIPWTDGQSVYLLQSTDISRIKEMEQMLLDAQEEAEQSEKAKSDFLSRMSHEIRTPMNAIIGMAEIAKKSDNIARIRECLERVDNASNHLLGIITDILDMSKIEAGRFELSNSDFTLEQMLQRVANLNNFRFEEKEQLFTMTVDPNVPNAIIADQKRLAQVLTNLLSNASKFTPNFGHIQVSVQSLGQEGDYITLQFDVQDDGIGIATEQQVKLFQAFEQVDGSMTRRFGGTGLGLTISKAIIEMMGGSISVESRFGQGSTFTFTVRAKPGFATRYSNLSPNIDWSQVRFLIADNSNAVRNYMGTFMKSLHIPCDIANSGEDVLLHLEKEQYHILFLGVTLPEMSDFSLLKQIHTKFPEQIVVIISSMGDWVQIQDEINALGVRHSLSTPLLPSSIIDCINICFGEENVPLVLKDRDVDLDRDIFLGRRLLLAEDIVVNREIIKAMLETTGIEIVEAENGKQAYELFAQNPGAFDIILMDIHMPLLDGYAATTTIRNMHHVPEAASIPIVAMTANVFQEDIEHCLAVGMNDHIGKPVNAEDMIAKMKRYMPVLAR